MISCGTKTPSGIEGVAEVDDQLGSALASGDFNCDGYDDLAIGTPSESVGTTAGAGAVNVLFGSSSGVSTLNSIWYQGTGGVDGTAEAYDYFGITLAAGNFNGDTSGGHGCLDLAIGAPNEDQNATMSDSGYVYIIDGTTSGLSSTGDQAIDQDVTSVADTAETNDQFAFRLESVYANVDSYEDLWATVPGDGCTTSAGWGRHTFHGSSGGLSFTDNAIDCDDFACEIDDGTYDCAATSRPVYGSSGADEIVLSSNDDIAFGGDGSDLIHGGAGNDVLLGSDSTDELHGDTGNDILIGGLGNDFLRPGPGVNLVDAGAGDDTIELRHTCEAASGSEIDGGAGYDVLHVPLALTATAMVGLSVTNVEEVIVYDADPVWTAASACASSEPTVWNWDATTGLRYRAATAAERERFGWLAGTVLMEAVAADITYGNTEVLIRAPGLTSGLTLVDLDFQDDFTGIPFHEIEFPAGSVTSVTPTFRVFQKSPGGSASWGTVTMDDYGGLSGWTYDGTKTWWIAGAESDAVLDEIPPPAQDPSSIDDYIVLQPAPLHQELDVLEPFAGEPYPGLLAGEGKWCTANIDNWMTKLFEKSQLINLALKEPVGPGATFDLVVAYCHIFFEQTIEHEGFENASDSAYFSATEVAKWCDAGTDWKEQFDGWPTRNDVPYYEDRDYWGLHLLECVDGDDHDYPFDNCAKQAFCYRDRAWDQAIHAQLHITVPNLKLAQVVHHGVMAGPNNPTLYEPYNTPGGDVVRGMSTRWPTGCSGLPSAGPDGCPETGASVANDSTPPWHLVGAHEVSHNFGPRDTDYEEIDPPPANCTAAFTIMGIAQVSDSSMCLVPDYGVTAFDTVLDCLADSSCPRSDYGP